MLEGRSVRLRAYEKEDLELARAYLNAPEVGMMLNTGICFPLRKEDEEKWYEAMDAKSEKGYNFAIELNKDSTYIGGCGIMDIHPKNHGAKVGIFLGKDHCAKGYGTEALQLLVNFCFEEVNLNRVTLHVLSINTPAIRCYEKVGFQTEGILREAIFRYGKYNDEIIMGVLRSDWQPRTMQAE